MPCWCRECRVGYRIGTYNKPIAILYPPAFVTPRTPQHDLFTNLDSGVLKYDIALLFSALPLC